MYLSIYPSIYSFNNILLINQAIIRTYQKKEKTERERVWRNSPSDRCHTARPHYILRNIPSNLRKHKQTNRKSQHNKFNLVFYGEKR